jgi:hypothetical protein
MFNSYETEALNQIRNQEQMQEANSARLASEAPRRTPFYAPMLAQLGNNLVAMGSDLQERYGELCDEVEQSSNATTPQPATPR